LFIRQYPFKLIILVCTLSFLALIKISTIKKAMEGNDFFLIF
jgi:hypothetical protein